MLAGHEQAVGGRIPGDAIEYVVHPALVARVESTQIEPGDDPAGHGIDTRDSILAPDVRSDFAVDVFEFIQAHDRHPAVRDVHVADEFEIGGIEVA